MNFLLNTGNIQNYYRLNRLLQALNFSGVKGGDEKSLSFSCSFWERKQIAKAPWKVIKAN